MSNPYAPQNETSAQIFSEKMWLQGALLSNIIYGVEFSLFVSCAHLLLRNRKHSGRPRQLFFLSFITIIFILGTIFMAMNVEFTQLAFIENRDFPGGPGAYEDAMYWIPEDETGNVSFVIADLLMDALLIWRCMVIYNSIGRYRWIVMLVPFLLLSASAALGVVFLAQTSTSSPFSDVNFGLAYFTSTLALNIIVSVLIVIRILIYRHRVKGVLGDSHVAQYGTIAAMIIESASLYSVFSLLFLVPYALNYPLSQLWLQGLGQVQTVSSLLVVHRVAQGKGWTGETATSVASSGDRAVRLQEIGSMNFRAGGSTVDSTVYPSSRSDIIMKGGNTV